MDSFFGELLVVFFEAVTRPPNPETIRALIKKHYIRRVPLNKILETLKRPPLLVAPGTVDATSAHLRLLVHQLLLVQRQRRDTDQYLERWFEQNQRATHGNATPSDHAILASLPGVGAFVLASLLSYAHDAVRLRNLDALRSLGGVAPVTKQSGKRRHVLMRRARSQPLNYALHHWAHMAVLRDPDFKDHYDRLRAKGHNHARALRGIMDRILTIAVAMLRDASLYQPSRRANNTDGNKSARKKVSS